MSLRTSSGAALLLLAACGGPPDGVAPGERREVGSGTPAEAPAEHVACAVGDAGFTDACTVDRSPTQGGTLLTIRRPDGGFRRLLLAADGSYGAADGAVPASVAVRPDGRREVSVAGERYLLPAGRP